MGKYLSKTDKNGLPVNALFVQAIVVTVILLLFGATTSGTLNSGGNNFFNRIMQATTSLATVQMIFYF